MYSTLISVSNTGNQGASPPLSPTASKTILSAVPAYELAACLLEYDAQSLLSTSKTIASYGPSAEDIELYEQCHNLFTSSTEVKSVVEKYVESDDSLKFLSIQWLPSNHINNSPPDFAALIDCLLFDIDSFCRKGGVEEWKAREKICLFKSRLEEENLKLPPDSEEKVYTPDELKTIYKALYDYLNPSFMKRFLHTPAAMFACIQLINTVSCFLFAALFLKISHILLAPVFISLVAFTILEWAMASIHLFVMLRKEQMPSVPRGELWRKYLQVFGWNKYY